MADQPTTGREGSIRVAQDGAIPRMGMSIPMPASTKPPAPPPSQLTGQKVAE